MTITERQLIETLDDPTMIQFQKNGWIVPNYVWAQENLESVTIPTFGRILLNQIIARKARLVFEMLTVTPKFAYGWSVRHKMHDPARGLSMHSWGLALDLTFDDARLELDEQMPSGVVDLFEEMGWEWGGRWSTPDNMHFQVGNDWLQRILATKGVSK